MPRFIVTVTVTKSDAYQMEIAHDSEEKAEREAMLAWRDQVSENFQVDKPDTWKVRSEQVSWNCVECGVEITEEQNRKGDEMCEKCVSSYDESEKWAKEAEYRSKKGAVLRDLFWGFVIGFAVIGLCFSLASVIVVVW